MIAASLVNFHNVMLIFSCFGNYFVPKDLRKWLKSRLILQLIFSFTIVTLLSVTEKTMSALSLTAYILSYIVPV